MTDEEIQTTNFLGIPFSAQSFTEARQAEEKAAADKIQKEKSNQLALDLEKARLEKNKQEDTEETVDIAEDIKSNKELFAELLGSKKARGQDISDMLLSFAGKALAPGADVKSALGEFAAEEAKRPSRASKIDESAAALAINDYIAGRKTAKALADQLTLFDKKLERQQSAGAITGKDFQTALTIVQDRYKGQYKRNSDTVVSETLKGLFEKPVFSVSGELDKIKAEDIKEGFTILTTKDGKYIIEKIGDSLKIRSDLLI
jgi:hypothetical protein